MPDEPGALWIPTTHDWAGDNHPRYVIVHGTGSSLTETPQNVAAYFQSNNPPTSTHYVIGRDGTLVQCVAEADAAWGNGVISAGADSWWAGNPNEYTISIEHVNDSANSTPLSPAQQAASFALIEHICERHAIPKRPADASGGITGHYSIDPVNRPHCPGAYPWAQLWAYLQGAPTVTYQIGTGMLYELAAHPELGSAISDEVYDGNGDAFVLTSSGVVLQWNKAAQTVTHDCTVLAGIMAANHAEIIQLQQQLAAVPPPALPTPIDPQTALDRAAVDAIYQAMRGKQGLA